MKTLLATILFISLCFSQLLAVDEVSFFNLDMGTLHETASAYSQALTTIACNQPVHVDKAASAPVGWSKVSVGPYSGFVKTSHLSHEKGVCLFDKYSKFIDALDLGISDLYYLGRLSDQFVKGQSQSR